jgi:protein gp37
MKFAHRGMSPQHRGLTFMNSKGPHWNGKINYVPEMLRKPLHWHTPRKIFLNSLSDLFHESVPDDWIDDVHGMMWACLYVGRSENSLVPGHVFQVLTKRPERARDYYATDRRAKWARAAAQIGGGEDPDGIHDQTYVQAGRGPHPRIWLGTSCEDQEAADERIPLLLQCSAAVRFVSAEPLLGPLDLRRYLKATLVTRDGRRLQHPDPEVVHAGGTWEWGLTWVIAGGESGPGSRPCDVAWVESIVQQCRETAARAFVKQLGARPYMQRLPEWHEHEGNGSWSVPITMADGRFNMRLQDKKGGDMAEFPPWLRVRQFPEVIE